MTTSAERQRVSLGPGDRVAVIAGSGRLPVDVASGLEELGQKPFVVLLDGEADGTELAGYETARIPNFNGRKRRQGRNSPSDLRFLCSLL